MFGNNDHPMTEREFNRSVAGWLTVGAFAAWMSYWQIQIKPWVYKWFGWLLAIMVAFLFVMGEGWATWAYLPLGVLAGLHIIGGIICLWGDWSNQIAERKVQYQQAYYDQLAAQQAAVVQAGVDKVRYDYAVAQETGKAVAEALRNQRPPEEPTGPSQRPPAPTPPSPPSPMGSTTPTLWVPTFHGPRKALQRREESLGGIWMNDHRGVDPDDL